MKSPLVSIIIPCFNREELIQETLNSVINQTYPHWEAIIVDDGSTDNSVAVVNEYFKKDNRIKLLLRNREPKNASVCRNIGIENSKGKYLIFLDSDDILAPNCLENRVEFMGLNQNIHFAVFQMAFFDNKGVIENSHITKKKENYLYSYLSYDLPWQTTCPIWKTSFVCEKIGGYNETYPRLQDVEFNTRALMIDKVKFKVLSETEPDCYYHNHTSKNFDRTILIKGFILYIDEFHEQVKNRRDYKTCSLHLKSCFKEAIRSYYSFKKKGFCKKEVQLILSFTKKEFGAGLIRFSTFFLTYILMFAYYLRFEKTPFGKNLLRVIMKLIKLS